MSHVTQTKVQINKNTMYSNRKSEFQKKKYEVLINVYIQSFYTQRNKSNSKAQEAMWVKMPLTYAEQYGKNTNFHMLKRQNIL